MLPTWVPSILQRVPGAQNWYRALLYATRKTVKDHMALFPFLWNLVGTWQKKKGNITGKIWHDHNSIPPLSSSQFPSLPHLQLDLETTNWLKGSLSYSPSFQFGILAVASLTILTNVTCSHTHKVTVTLPPPAQGNIRRAWSVVYQSIMLFKPA